MVTSYIDHCKNGTAAHKPLHRDPYVCLVVVSEGQAIDKVYFIQEGKCTATVTVPGSSSGQVQVCKQKHSLWRISHF